MKLLILACAAATLLTSCAGSGITLTASTPWGDVSSINGGVAIAPKPIVFPTK